MKKVNLDEELKDLSPLLNDLKKQTDGFNVPDAYFEKMEEAVWARLQSSGDLDRPALELKKRPGLFRLAIGPRMMAAMAASLALVLAAVWFLRTPATVQPAPIVSMELTEDDLESYVLENVHQFEPEQLATLTPQESVEPALLPTPKKAAPADEIHPEDLEEVLDQMTDEELEQIL